MLISKDKMAGTVIILPAEPTEREAFAASELQKYIKRIIGAEPVIRSDREDSFEQMIAIGGPERNAVTKGFLSEEEFDRMVPGPEGFCIKTYGEHLILAGSSKNSNECERGTVYAVYEFLERFAGCSLAAYSKQGVSAGEYLGEPGAIELSDISYIKPCADVPYRAAVVQYSSHGVGMNHELNIPFLDWLCKNRYNYIFTWNGVYENFKKNGMLQESIKRGILFKVGHHDAIDTLLPQMGNQYFPEHYYETHPEYYKLMENGERFRMTDHWGQMILCSRNEDCIRQLSENLIQWFRQNPQVKIFSLMNKDGTAPQCCCEKCIGKTKVENYVYMINEIAKNLKKAIPDVTLNMLAYTDLWEAPQMQLESNVSVTESTWHITGLRTVGKPDGSCLAGTFFEENLLNWKAKGADVSYYDYFMGVYPGRQRYLPMADEMQSMCKRFMEKGISGTETQIEVYNLWNHIFNFYTYGRTAYDTSLSMEENLNLFCRIFGQGGEYMKENIKYAESVLDGQCEIKTAGIYLMEHIDKKRMYDGFTNALRAAEKPLCRNNVRLMRMAFRYSDLECRETHSANAVGYSELKHYEIEERGELLYMRRRFDSYTSGSGYGIMIPAEGSDNGFEPDEWYLFE